MPTGKSITNPNNVFGQTNSDSNYPQTYDVFKNTGAAAISYGDTVATKYTVSGTLMECEAFDTDASGQNARIGVGVALESIAVNASGRIATGGFAQVNVGAATPAEGDVCIGTTTAGVAGTATPDATTVAGTVLGMYLAAKDANNRAPVWVSPR